MSARQDAYDKLAASKLPEDRQAGFRVYLYQELDSGVLLTGTWPDALFKSGPRKGEPNWNAAIKQHGKATVAVSMEEYRGARSRLFAKVCEEEGEI